MTALFRVKLYKGGLYVARPQEPRQPLQPADRHHGRDPTKAYNQDDATGFIRLNALRLKVAAKRGGPTARPIGVPPPPPGKKHREKNPPPLVLLAVLAGGFAAPFRPR